MSLLASQHGRRRRYYTPNEVAAHNSADDAWVSLNGRVLNLTELVTANRGTLTQPLVANAGRDISHWFDGDEVKTHWDEARELFVPYTPMGRFLHVAAASPQADCPTANPWWRDEAYVIGRLSANVRLLRVVNTLTKQADVLEVCGEETLAEIQTRYLDCNAHAPSYTWKQLGEGSTTTTFTKMDMTLTLEQAGIPDEAAVFDDLHIDRDAFIPTVHVYFNDDLTAA